MTKLSERTVPSTSRRGGVHWLASEWGLAALALILAVLIWAVVWGEIPEKDPPRLQAKLDLQPARGFTAYYQGSVGLVLKGPRGEVEEARRALGVPPRVVVSLDPLEPQDNVKRFRIERDMMSFPFPARLVDRVDEPEVEMYRWLPHSVTFKPPKIEGIPRGYGHEISLDPAMSPVEGPAGKINKEIQPDPIDVRTLFAVTAGRPRTREERIPVSFQVWRNDPEEQLFRRDVALPGVTATIRFFPTAERKIKNRFQFEGLPEGYEITSDFTVESVDQGYFEGTFTGREEDLEKLASLDLKEAWWFVGLVPRKKLPVEAGEVVPDVNIPVEFARTAAVDELKVEFTSRVTLIVSIKKQ